ncbi:MAG: phosphopantothenoylcysteine decarboxylase, partial [Ignavibacteria bacterium]|nr:phosphopantothenoylcysteine decarboxylase [Ignavibacteria bacterium]
KNLDLIVLNSLSDAGAGFKHQTNKVTLIDKNETLEIFPLKSKIEVAEDITNTIKKLKT